MSAEKPSNGSSSNGAKDSKLTVGRWMQTGNPIRLPAKVHRDPLYFLGVSGSGKSVLLGNLALQWSDMGEGVLLIDVKDGQLARDVAARADPAKLIYVAPGTCVFNNKPYHWGLNILELPNRRRPTISKVVGNVLSMLERLDRADYSQMTVLRTNLDSAVRLVLYEEEPNLQKVRKALTDPDYRQYLLERHEGVLNEEVADHFERLDDKEDTTTQGRNHTITSTVNRLKEILTPPELKFMVVQQHSTMRFKEWLEAGMIVVVDCVTGLQDEDGLSDHMSDLNAELLGNLVLTQAMHFTFTRAINEDDPWEGRTRSVRLICDEFDLLAGNNFARLITKARSYRVFPVMAHQNLDQLLHDREKGQRLWNAASGVPIEFTLTLTDRDRSTVSKYRELPEIAKYQASLKLRTSSLPLGLLDAGQSTTIRLNPWMTAKREGQLEAFTQRQQDPTFTVSEKLVREKMETSYEQFEAWKSQQPTKQRPGRQAKTGSTASQSRAGRQSRQDDGRDSGSVPGDVPAGEPEVSEPLADRQTVFPGAPRPQRQGPTNRGRS